MGLFDTLSKVGAAVSGAVENAANEYKEKKAYEAAEGEMKAAINEDLNEYAEKHIMAMDDDTAELVMSIEILVYDSFEKDGYANGIELLGATAFESDITEWASEFRNSEALVKCYESFYKNYYYEATQSDWYKNIMAPFYGEEAKLKLIAALNLMMMYYIGDLADKVCEHKYGEDNVVWDTIRNRHFDFWDPLVAYFMNNDDDMELSDNLDKYEKKCFKRYRNVSLYLIAKNAGMCNKSDELEHVFRQENGEPIFVGVVNNSLAYLSAEYPEITKISQLKNLDTVKPETVKFEDIIYWKQSGEKRTELGIKKPSAAVAVYAAYKGVVAPQRLEEREIDTREIELVTQKGKMHFSINSLPIFEKLLPQFEYDIVMINK